MTVYADFMKGLNDWFVLISGIDAANIFRGYQQNPDLGPNVDWLTYKEIDGDSRDYHLQKTEPNATEPTAEQDTTRVLPGTSVVSVNVYAENGADILKSLWLSRAERDARKILKTAKVVLFGMSGPRDLSVLSDTQWKHRWQADFTFRTHTERVETDYIVDVFDLDGKIETDTVNVYVDRNG